MAESNNALVVQDSPAAPYQVFDALDDAQLVEELKGHITSEWVYDVGGKVGISKKGIDQCMVEMNKQGWVFEEGLVDYKIDPTNDTFYLFQAIVKGYRYTPEGVLLKQGEYVGTKRQCSLMKVGDDWKDDPFWFEKGCSKALRNAKIRFVPADIETAIVTLAKKSGKVKQVKTRNGQARQAASNKPTTTTTKPAQQTKKVQDDAEAKAYRFWEDAIPEDPKLREPFLNASSRRFYMFMDTELGLEHDEAQRQAERYLGLQEGEISSIKEVLGDPSMRRSLNISAYGETGKVLFL